MLRWRLLLGTVLVTALVGLCWLDYQQIAPRGAVLFVIALGVAVLAAGELLALLASRDLRPLPWAVYVGNLLIVGSNAVPLFWDGYPADCPLGILGWPLASLAVAVILVFAGEMRRYEKPGGVIVNAALASFSFVYIAVPLSFLIRLRLFGGNRQGMIALASLIAVVKLCDVGAYTVGRLVGRHKMTPVLSPGKTWEGLAGGLVFACAGSVGIFGSMASGTVNAQDVAGWIAFGLIVGGAGVLGDLAESLLKRDMGQKDSSTWMPGFGGVLDLLDSILLAAPIAYLCWVLGLIATE